jgi:peroxiredoxin Q/BCP
MSRFLSRFGAPLAETLRAGDLAPDVRIALDDGTTLSTRAPGGPLVLYFYPRDDTPGCTKEACAFRDRTPELAAAGATVVGISFDGAASHARFKEKHAIPFKLATDAKGEIAAAFGVAVRGFWPVTLHARDTIVIGRDGRLLAVLRGVSPIAHVDEVLRALAPRAGAT